MNAKPWFFPALTTVLLVGCTTSEPLPRSQVQPTPSVQTQPVRGVDPVSDGKHQGTIVSVVGVGEVKQVPNQATLTAGVSTLSPTAQAALQGNSAIMQKLLAALKALNIPDKNIQTTQLSVYPQMQYDEGQPPKVTSYQASNQVSIQVDQLDQLGPVIDALVTQGANNIQGPQFNVANKDQLLSQARQLAVQNARQQAQEYAQALGMKVKRVVSVGQSTQLSPQPPMPMMAMSEAARSTPVMSGEHTVNVEVGMVVELE